jgi:hypothetical protein
MACAAPPGYIYLLTFIPGVRVAALHILNGDKNEAAQVQAGHLTSQRPSGRHLYDPLVF